jgi:AcrR family transcriptional regulator
MADALAEAGCAPAPTDRRSIRTRRALRDALAAEVEATGNLSQVTVTAVSDRAGVTRRTFYSHFRDIPDLVSQTEDEAVDQMRRYVASVAAIHLDQLADAISRFEPCPGSVELLQFFKDRASYLPALLGNGGDPAFVEKIKRMVYDTVADRALDGIDVRIVGPIFDYYLTFVISAEVGVLVRWLEGGMQEGVRAMACIMTALSFVRPGDLYGKPLDSAINSVIHALGTDPTCPKETNND